MEDTEMTPAAAASTTTAAIPSSTSSSLVPASSRYTYIVTAQPPTVVTHTLVCHFLAPHELNVIVVRKHRIEIYRCVEDGVESVHEIGLYGRVASIVSYRAKNDVTDRLFITTDRHKFFVLKWDMEKKEIQTEFQGDAKLKIGRASEQSAVGLLDPSGSWFGLHQYDGLFQMLAIDPITGAPDKILHDMKLDQLQVIQMTFIHKQAKPTLAVLSIETTHGQDKRVLKSYTYESKEKEMKESKSIISVDSCDVGASNIIATVFGGVILIAEQSVTYVPVNSKHHISVRPSEPLQVTATATIDPRRYLLGDIRGNLWVLLFEDGQTGSTSDVLGPSVNLRLEYLGHTTIAHTLSYIDKGFVFVGSVYGDSQLIRLSAEPIPISDTTADMEGEEEEKKNSIEPMDLSEGDAPAAAASSSSSSSVVAAGEKPKGPNFIEVMTEFNNLGAICDLAMVDLDRSGQCQLMTCSGAYQDSSLRVVRNGIGIHEEASIEVEGIQGVWGIKQQTNDEFHKYLLQTYAAETRILALKQDEESEELALDECEINGFDAGQSTIHASNMGTHFLLQVTQQSCRLVDATSLELVDEFRPNTKITVATSNTQLLLLAAGKQVMLLSVSAAGKFQPIHQVTLDEEISCMDIAQYGSSSTPYGAIGMWRDNTVRLYNLTTMTELTRERLGEMLARSVLFTQFDHKSTAEAEAHVPTSFLLCGLGDGHLVSFEFHPQTAALTARKKIALGTSGIELRSFQRSGEFHVFVSCDRPTVVSSAHGKLLYSNVNLRDLTHMTPFHASVFKDCLALVSSTQLMIGRIDEIEKLHIKKVHIGGHARRIAHQTPTKTIAVSVMEMDEHNEESKSKERCKLKLLDDQTFRILDTITLKTDEQIMSIRSRKLLIGAGVNDAAAASSSSSGTLSDYYLIGTAIVNPQELEPSLGRILIVHVDPSDQRARIVCSADVKGGAMSVDVIHGRVIAAVNAKVVIYRCITSLESAPGEFRLEKECDYVGSVFILRLRISQDGQYIFVHDLIKSMSILLFNAANNTNGLQTAHTVSSLEEVARHHESNWLTAFESFSPQDDVLLMSDHFFNLLTVRRNVDPTISAEDRGRLESLGQWHSGEFVNVIARGSLVMNLPTDATETTTVPMETSATSSPSASSIPSANDDRVLPTHALGCASGAILVAAPLSASSYKFFARLEEALAATIRGVGGLTHREWRQYQANTKTEDSKAFIDGDLIQMFLELSPQQQATIANKIGVKKEECIKRVEDVSRIH